MKHQHGVALLTAIFVVALATIAATALATSAAIAVRRAENMQGSEVARWYAEGVESWALSVINLDAQSGKKSDSLGDPWAQPVAGLPVDNGTISGQIVDLQGLFNLNCLAVTSTNQATLKANLDIFNRLLENLPGIDPNSATGIGDAIVDWVDQNDERSGTSGFEDGDYLGLDPPYRAANQWMQSTTELMAVHGMTPQLYEALRPYVSALPTTDLKINVNTAPKPVLLALSSSLSSSNIDTWLEDRIKSPATSAADFQKATEQANQPSAQGQTTSSTAAVAWTTSYLELRAQIVVGSNRVALYSVIYKQQATGGAGTSAAAANGSGPVVIAHSTDSD